MLQELCSRHLVHVRNYVDATSAGLHPVFLLEEDKLPICCVNKWFIYPTCRAAQAGCLKGGSPIADHASQLQVDFLACITHYPMPKSNHLIVVSSLLISYCFSWLLGWPSSEVRTFSQNCFLGLYLLNSACFCRFQGFSYFCACNISFIQKFTLGQFFFGVRLQVLQFQVLSKAINPNNSQHLEIHRLQFP